jgi:hypothetical protein
VHVLRKPRIHRRTLLRGALGGAAVAVALPPLEAMLDAHGEAYAGGDPLPTRFVSWMAGNGVLLDRFEPETVGDDWELSPQLAPLEAVKDYINVCTGFQNKGMAGGFVVGHIEGITAYSGYPYAYSEQFFDYQPSGPTLDQVIADAIEASGVALPVRSLQLGVSKSVLAACALYSSMSFRGSPGALTSLPPQYNPRLVWESLFGSFPGPDALEDDRVLRANMLDVVRDQTQALRSKLGVADRQRLDAHLEGVQELSQKISSLPAVCELPAEPTQENSEPVGAEHLVAITDMMAELLVYALQCDITRVASIMFLPPAAETPLQEIGIAATHHLLSHDAQYNPVALEELHQGVVFCMERLGAVANAMRNAVDPTGANLLDSTIMLASSDLSIGWRHSIERHPMVLIGSGGGHLRHPGTHVQAIENNPGDPNGMNLSQMIPAAGNTSDILLSCLLAFDPAATSVGGGEAQSTTPLSAILA